MKFKRDTVLTISYVICLCLLAGIGYALGDYTAQKNEKQAQEVRLQKMNPNFASNVGFVDLPRISITLSSGSSGSGRLRIDMSLEVEKQYLARVMDYQPSITDHLVSYMHKLNSRDIQRPEAVPLLRKEFLKEVNSGISPVPVMDVVFRQFLVI